MLRSSRDTSKRVEPISPRIMTIGYTSALLVIGGLSVASHYALDQSLKRDKGNAATINQSGRQRMLSQRIAGLAAEYRMGDVSARQDLISAIGEFQAGHKSLVSTVSVNSRDPEAQELRSLYFGGANSLDAQVQGFLSDARKVVELSPADPAMSEPLSRIFAKARSPLLAALEKIVTFEQRKSELQTVYLKNLETGILVTLVFTLLLEALAIFRPMIKKISDYTRELLNLATTDALTGLLNRRAFMEMTEIETIRASRYGRASSLLLLDIDHFKSINDTYGHAAGDEVLRVLGNIIRANVRKTDIVGRIGGEEFAITLVETDLDGGSTVANRIRSELFETEIIIEGKKIKTSASLGVARLRADAGGLKETLSAADKLLYQAKNSGRNRVIVDESPANLQCDDSVVLSPNVKSAVC